MKCLVHRRPWQVVHRCINDAEVLLITGLHVQHFGHADASVAHQRSAGLDHQLALAKTPRVESLQQLGPQGVCLWWRIAVVVNSQATTKINVLNGYSSVLDAGHQIQHAVHRIEVRGLAGDLRSDMAVDPDDTQACKCRCTLVGRQCALVGNAELVALQTSGNVRVGLGVHIGVDANADRRDSSAGQCDFVENVDFSLALHIEAANPGKQRFTHFEACLANAGENDL